MTRRHAAVAWVALVGALPGSASAYCRRSVCDGRVGTSCLPARAGDCGTPVRWPAPCVSFSLSASLPAGLRSDTALALMTAAFATWTTADCGGGRRPGLRVTHLGPVTCAAHEYNAELSNANLVVFHDGAWPYGLGEGKLALTSVSYGAGDAAIYDADIELNWRELQGMDLPSIALHEAGHFLGLAHSEDPASVMSEDVHAGAVFAGVLSPDDVRAICASYPPGAALACDATPRHGLRSACPGAGNPTRPDAKLAVAPGRGLTSLVVGLATLLAGLAWLVRRRRRGATACRRRST